MAEILPTSCPWARLFLTFTQVHRCHEKLWSTSSSLPACSPQEGPAQLKCLLESLPMLMGVSSLTSNELGLHIHCFFSSNNIAKLPSHSALSPSTLISCWCFPGCALLFHPDLPARRLLKMFSTYQRFPSAWQYRDSCCTTCFTHTVGLMLCKFMYAVSQCSVSPICYKCLYM